MLSLGCAALLLSSLCYPGYALPRRVQSETGTTKRSFELPIVRHGRRSDHVKRQNSGSSELGDDRDLLYTVPITLGSTQTAVNLDTGSADLWVISDECTSKLCQKATVPSYPTANFKDSGATVNLTYGDSATGTFASGPIGSDAATLAGFTVQNQYFAAIDSTTNPTTMYNAAGIFGLSFPSESQIQEQVVTQQSGQQSTTDQFVATTSSNGPLLSRMAMSGELEQPMFTITLQRDTVEIDGQGVVTVGKLPDGVDNSSLTWVPVRLYTPENGGQNPPTFAPDEVYPLRWEVAIDAVFMDGQQLADSTVAPNGVTNPGLSALIDTGNSVIRGPSDVVNSLISSVSPAFAANSSADPTLPCGSAHTMAFQIGGQMFPVDPRDFISPGKHGNATECLANNVVSTDPPSVGSLFSWSLGDPFMKSNLVAFYMGNLTNPSVDPPRMGFMSTVPADASQDLLNDVQAAQANGDVFSSTIDLPLSTASGTSGQATLSMPPNMALPTSSSAANAASTGTSSLKENAARSLRSSDFTVLVAFVVLFFGFSGL